MSIEITFGAQYASDVIGSGEWEYTAWVSEENEWPR